MKYLFIFLSYVASPKFCLHCTHFIPNQMGNEFGTCKFFPVQTDSLVTDKKEIQYNYCDTARQFDNMCGKYAKRYFPRNIEIEPTGGKGNTGGGGWDDDFISIIPTLF
jgi:hypothetical protein